MYLGEELSYPSAPSWHTSSPCLTLHTCLVGCLPEKTIDARVWPLFYAVINLYQRTAAVIIKPSCRVSV